MFSKVLVANRGEIACRIVRTLKRMGIQSIAVYSEADRHSKHVLDADEAYLLGPAPASESYLNIGAILEIAKESGAQAIHPGYGFLSENSSFAKTCEAVGITFIGPTPKQIEEFGLKHTAREIAKENRVTLLPGSDLLKDLAEGLEKADQIGYPVMLKSTAGGGGIGLRLCENDSDLKESFETVQRLGKSNFKESGVYLEKYVSHARHIEIQIFGDGKGNVVSLGERDCSIQRRNQKVIEESPAIGLPENILSELYESAVRLAKAVDYRSAGTVEFVYDALDKKAYFLEVNTRLQVEHSVTEERYDIDLVEWMIRIAAGDFSPLQKPIPKPAGHAIQVRVYAEDASKNFQPVTGVLTEVILPFKSARCDYWIERGTNVSPFYDPLLARIISKGKDRSDSISNLIRSLDATVISGLESNLDYLKSIAKSKDFSEGELTTKYLNTFQYTPHSIDVLDPGTFTTLQDYPGRLGYWAVGVPPSGPMDNLAFRLGNRILGNESSAVAMECTVSGPTLYFPTDTEICITGANMTPTLNGQPIAQWQRIFVSAGSTLKLGLIQAGGLRTYVSVLGGFIVPDYLGSKSTFTLGQFGGHGGRTLQIGDVLKIHDHSELNKKQSSTSTEISDALIPTYANTWNLKVIYGPHGAPDFFTESDIETFFSADYKVHFNSSRTGVRLVGPKPQWARKDGGEAGLHPSNIHDNAYAIGTIDFTGDMPIILGPDGPSLGGFVCPATIISADLWKIGQLKPGDLVRFERVEIDEALYRLEAQEQQIRTLRVTDLHSRDKKMERRFRELSLKQRGAVLHNHEGEIEVTYRLSGDSYLLVEYGELILDLKLRFRVHSLMTYLEKQMLLGIVDLTPGIRSLQIHFDNALLTLADLMQILLDAEQELPAVDNLEVPSRIVHLPLSWDDAATRLAIEKYMAGVRRDAPWCPSNIEFIRRINGLDSIDDVKRIVLNANYMVLGLGDVYLGAPVATPLDPRHRLVTTKYNPARTWTPENAVGIGGAYMCVYGMEGPGGYQFVGRTIQMWNRYRTTLEFKKDYPWLLRFFDQIRFYPVSHDELLEMRESFPYGKTTIKMEDTIFKFEEYESFLNSIQEESNAFKLKQQKAFDEERERWKASPYVSDDEDSGADLLANHTLPEGVQAIVSHMTASVWKLQRKIGDSVEIGDKVAILESMKMEVAVSSPIRGTIKEILVSEGKMVNAGQQLFLVESKG